MSRADTQEDLNAVIRLHSELLAAQLHSQRESLFPPDASKSMRKFTSGEAAALLGVNDPYLRKLHLDGKGPIVSPLGVVTKDIRDEMGEVIGQKERLILDPKKVPQQ